MITSFLWLLHSSSERNEGHQNNFNGMQTGIISLEIKIISKVSSFIPVLPNFSIFLFPERKNPPDQQCSWSLSTLSLSYSCFASGIHTYVVLATENLILSLAKFASDPFPDLIIAFKKWDSQVACDRFW